MLWRTDTLVSNRARSLLAALWLAGCAATTDREPQPDEACDVPAGGGVEIDEPLGAGTAVIVGCRREPLVLGEVSDVEQAAPQVVWTGNDFAVGWASGDGYHIRITNGRGTSNSKHLPGTPSSVSWPPQLLWVNDRLELYYALSDSVFVDLIAFAPTGLTVTQTNMIGFGFFRAVQMEPDRIAVLTPTALYVDGAEVGTRYMGGSALGWNGDNFLVANVTGHGEWRLHGVGLDGSNLPPAIDLVWCGGCSTTGSGGGSAFASSASAGRHAVVVASDRSLTIAVEGQPAIERELLAETADASMIWDGERYVVLLADQAVAGAGVGRDIGLLAVTADGVLEMAEQPLVPISQDAAEERYPVGAAARPGDYGIAWIRGNALGGNELVIQRCALTER